MSRLKRSSKVLDRAERRIAGIRIIDPDLDLGNGLSIATYSALINDLRTKLDTYNGALSNVDVARHAVLETEKQLGNLSEHMLLGVATRFGKNSDEYQMAGGIRKTDYKRKRTAISG